ncbi:MAG: sulfur carrier protein ThiS [Campylobacterota bacterium]|nr:sulfur carrier protein ThiS [Campylobacterota bacterium]
MDLIVNGDKISTNENSSLEQIMIELEIIDKVMAAAINMEIVKKEDWSSVTPKDNDKIELLQFVGGG